MNDGDKLARDDDDGTTLPRGTNGRLDASNWERARSRELFPTRCMADWSLCLTSAAFCGRKEVG